MVKEILTFKSAAGLRRSAIAERIRIQNEWSSLKGTDDESEPPAKTKKKTVLSRNLHNIRDVNRNTGKNMLKSNSSRGAENRPKTSKSSNETLRGVVALVDVGSESRALALRAALAALGATVVPTWSPHVTHLVWSHAGDRDTRARARALACRVVSPLWVEACAASARRISEKVFPSTARDSDLPSPATLCNLLKRAEKENWCLAELVSDSEEDARPMRLRISSDTDDHTKTRTSGGDTSVDVESRVNTAPRRALPTSISPPPANPKSRRKLFTVRAEPGDDSDAEKTPPVTARPKTDPKRPKPQVEAPERRKKTKNYNLAQEQKRNAEKAEGMARRLATNANPAERGVVGTQTQRSRSTLPRIVLSGMAKSQHQAVSSAIHSLNGKVQRHVNRRTTHVLLGSCKEDSVDTHDKIQNKSIPHIRSARNTPQQWQKNKNHSTTPKSNKRVSVCNQCNNREVMEMFEKDDIVLTNHCANPMTAPNNVTVICSTVNLNPIIAISDNVDGGERRCDVHEISDLCDGVKSDKRLRTLKTLLGAARGCRVLHAQWAMDCQKEGKWQPHIGYEVTHLMKIAQKARIERSVTEKMHAEYAYDVFRGMRVRVADLADQRDAAMQLLSLCGAQIVDVNGNTQEKVANDGRKQNGGRTQHGGRTQNGGRTQHGGQTQNGAETDDDCDIVVRIGKGDDEVSSKWVFDSVAAARPRTTRRYINKNIPVHN